MNRAAKRKITELEKLNIEYTTNLLMMLHRLDLTDKMWAFDRKRYTDEDAIRRNIRYWITRECLVKRRNCPKLRKILDWGFVC